MPSRIETKSHIDTEFSEIIRRNFPDQAYIQNDGTIGYRPSKSEGYLLGSPDFPVARYRELIVDTVSSNLLTIITAKTGTGKSTNVPQYLFESGLFDRVTVTQPRVLAARELKNHVSADMAEALHDREHGLAGFQTAVEGDSTEENAILYVTDGLQLMREITKHGIAPNQVLIIDEFHERSGNMDALLAIAIKFSIRTVIMSATLNAENISSHYQEILDAQVPIIDIPGSAYDVKERESDNLDQEIVNAAKQNKNILVFLPGRREINSAMSRIKRRIDDKYTLLALHGDQTPDEQRRVMGSYPAGKIIFSTSIGQTSITIPDVDIVIDSGYERTNVLSEAGKETLATQPSSKATSDQRRGRVGRTKPGEYVRAQLKSFPILPRVSERDDYDMPEIRRMRLDDLQLKLAAFGHSILSLPFYQQPKEIEINRSNERLTRLEFFRNIGKTALDGYHITEMGEKAARLPLDANSSRMLIESRQFGPEVELQMMAAVSVRQINGITITSKGMENWRGLSKEKSSDIIAGIDFMFGAMQRNEQEQTAKHIVKLRYDKALRTFEQLAKRRSLDIYDLKAPTPEQREHLHQSIIAGTDELFVLSGKSYFDDTQKRRHPVSNTIITEGAELLIGNAFDLQQVRRKKIGTHMLIAAPTAVSFDSLQALLPHRIKRTIDKLYVDDEGQPRTIESLIFDGKPTRYKIIDNAQPSLELQRFIIEHIFSNKSLGGKQGENIKQVRREMAELRKLQHKTNEDLGIEYSLKTDIIERMLHETNYRSVTFNQVDQFIDVKAVEDIVPPEIREEINAHAPDTIVITHERRKVHLDVTYYDNEAYITAQPYLYASIPFTINNKHKVNVKPTEKHALYMRVGKARDKYKEQWQQPTRDERRGLDAQDPKSAHASTAKQKISPKASRLQPNQQHAKTRRSR